MELDQLLYKKLSSYFSKRRNKDSKDEIERTVHLEDYKNQWIVLAQALTGESIKLVQAEKEGGWKDNTFFLPSSFNLFSTKKANLDFYIFRLFYLSFLSQLDNEAMLFSSSFYIDKDSELNQKVVDRLFGEYPRIKAMYVSLEKELIQYYQVLQSPFNLKWLLGKWMPSNNSNGHNKSMNDELGASALPKVKTEIKAKPVDEVESLQVDKKAQEEYTLMHNFEKVETIEEFSGPWRDFDGEDELEQHEEALSQISMRHTVRVDDETHSVYQSEFISNAHIPESTENQERASQKIYRYDEWNFSNFNYKKDYCKVYESTILAKDKSYTQQTLIDHKSSITVLKKQLANFFNKLEEVKRLHQGEHMNMDALTELFIEQQAGKSPNDKIYDSKRYLKKDISILFLLDLSLSSDGYAGGNRIIDVEKQMSIVIGELLDEYGIAFQIDGFSSKTRNYCSYKCFKSFSDSWQRKKDVIGSITPEGYTRIGPALRHAKSILSKQSTSKKWLVILSDGKPNDYDKYEGHYGIADVKQAIRELHSSHIGVHTFAIDQQAKFYLPQIFGKSNYNVLAHPKEMLLSITQFFQRIMTI